MGAWVRQGGAVACLHVLEPRLPPQHLWPHAAGGTVHGEGPPTPGFLPRAPESPGVLLTSFGNILFDWFGVKVYQVVRNKAASSIHLHCEKRCI